MEDFFAEFIRKYNELYELCRKFGNVQDLKIDSVQGLKSGVYAYADTLPSIEKKELLGLCDLRIRLVHGPFDEAVEVTSEHIERLQKYIDAVKAAHD